MKIIDNKKDYYDYLIGILGIDTHVVYDRRGSIVLNKQLVEYFSTQPLNYDRPRKMQPTWENSKLIHKLEGKLLWFVLEVGYTHYFFKVERYYENDVVTLKQELIYKKEQVTKKLVENAVMALVPCSGAYTYKLSNCVPNTYYTHLTVVNPILLGTFIPAFIGAEEIYDIIYNYIMSTLEPNIEDKRNDIEKLESHGMDKKTSFRNVK